MASKPLPSRLSGILVITVFLGSLWSPTLVAGETKKVPLSEQFKNLADSHCAWLVANAEEVERREEAYQKELKKMARANRLDQGLVESLLSSGNYELYQIPAELVVAIAKHRLGPWENFPLPSECLRAESERIKGIWEVRLFMRRAVDRKRGITMAFGYNGKPTKALRMYMEKFGADENTGAYQFIVSGVENLVPLLDGLGEAGLLKK